jgi:hypothetical protein
MVMELALEAAEEKRSGVVMAVPNCIGGSAGTGRMPAARELVRGASEDRGGATDWFGSEIRRDLPGCSLWMLSVSLVGRLGLLALVLAEGGTATLCLTTVFISKSSWELVELLELSTGDGADSPFPNAPRGGRGTRPVDTLLDDRLVRDESMILSTSLPFIEMLPMSIGL